jgi:hypothetical protein
VREFVNLFSNDTKAVLNDAQRPWLYAGWIICVNTAGLATKDSISLSQITEADLKNQR